MGRSTAVTSACAAISNSRDRSSHTAGRIVRELREVDATIDDALERDASVLDLFNLASRYPDTIIAPEDAAIAVGRTTQVVG